MAPYLSLLPEDAGQRRHDLSEVFNSLRYVIKGGVTWRLVPNVLPPWEIVYQQTQRWLRSGVFEAMVHACGSCCAPSPTARAGPPR